MKYKVGDKVKIKSLDWYYRNSDCMGNIQCGDWYFTVSQTSYCGKVLTISAICDDFYMMKGIGHHWTDEMIEGLVDEPQEKMVSLDKARKWLERTLYIHTKIEEDKDWCETNTFNWVTSDYESVEDFINGFCKAMEE